MIITDLTFAVPAAEAINEFTKKACVEPMKTGGTEAVPIFTRTEEWKKRQEEVPLFQGMTITLIQAIAESSIDKAPNIICAALTGMFAMGYEFAQWEAAQSKTGNAN